MDTPFPRRVFLFLALLAAPAAAQAERWIVHFKHGGIDLSPLARATRMREPASVTKDLVADFERRARAEQAPCVEAITRLGGKVHAQWWIVNACAVELPAGQVDAVRALPAALRLERDLPQRAASGDPHDRYNHAVDGLHAAGLSGAGVVIAMVDSGFDVQMGSSGRPHRVFFRGGDPGNVSDDGAPWNPGRTVIAATIDSQGEVAVPLSLPGSPSLVGLGFDCQFLALDPAANALGLTTSRGGAMRIGVP